MNREIERRPLLVGQGSEKEIPPQIVERFRVLATELPKHAVAFLAEAGVGGLCGVTKSVVGITGLSSENLFGQSVFDWMPPEAEEQVRERLAGLDPRTNFETECQIPTWDEGLAVIRAAVKLVVEGEKAFLIGVGIDTTESDKRRQELESENEELHKLILVDELTGLYNRRGLMALGRQQLEAAKRIGAVVFLIFADFDHLKGINDTLGHLVGDQALIEVAKVCKGTCRDADIVARVSGDEFVIMGVETGEGSGENLIVRLQDVLDARNAETGCSYKLSLSFGLASCGPKDFCSIEELLAGADRAMYGVKEGNS